MQLHDAIDVLIRLNRTIHNDNAGSKLASMGMDMGSNKSLTVGWRGERL